VEIADAVAIGQDLMLTSLILIAPIVAVSLVVGLIISIGQTITSIQEQTLSFAPRIVAVVLLLVVLMPWYLSQMLAFTNQLISEVLPRIIQ
jgi:flagellar biosynthetic protein FliQ